MRNPLLPEVERGRVIAGMLQSRTGDGANGAFMIDSPDGVALQIIASDGGGWDHVSVTPRHKKRCPTWEEMTFVKDLFFDAEEVVYQLHPARSQYINNHDYVLHLWRPQQDPIPTPPGWMVGIKARRRR